MTTRIAQLSFAALAVLAVACGRPDDRDVDTGEESEAVTPSAPARVSNIELGSAVGANLRVSEATTTFGPQDTMFLSVMTSNASEDSRVSARWTAEDGSVIDSSGQSVARDAGTTAAVTQFRVVSEDGWEPGKYTVDIWLNDAPVGTREFEVTAQGNQRNNQRGNQRTPARDTQPQDN